MQVRQLGGDPRALALGEVPAREVARNDEAERIGHGPLRDAGIVRLCVPELARLVDVLAGQADVFDRQLVPVQNMLVVGLCLDLAALLRGVVLIGEAALCRLLDLKRIGLRATY